MVAGSKQRHEIPNYTMPDRTQNHPDDAEAAKIGREISDITLGDGVDSEADTPTYNKQKQQNEKNKFWQPYRPAVRRGLCLMDCCGIFTAMMCWAIVLSSFHVLATVVYPFMDSVGGVITFLLLLFFAVMSLWAHAACMTADPGIVPLCNEIEELSTPDEAAAREEGYTRCNKCDIWRPPRAHHCSTCRRCVLKMDHHCPWMNNCIGANNQKYFLQFLLYIFLLSSSALILFTFRIMTCHSLWLPPKRSKNKLGQAPAIQPSAEQMVLQARRDQLCYFESGVALSAIFVFFAAIVFALFTVIMMIDQVAGLMGDVTGIELLKQQQKKTRTLCDSLRELFGGPFSWRWFVPFRNKQHGFRE